jgi:hypothetical protein
VLVTINNESLCCMFIEVFAVIGFLGNVGLCFIVLGKILDDHQNRPCSRVCFLLVTGNLEYIFS